MADRGTVCLRSAQKSAGARSRRNPILPRNHIRPSPTSGRHSHRTIASGNGEREESAHRGPSRRPGLRSQPPRIEDRAHQAEDGEAGDRELFSRRVPTEPCETAAATARTSRSPAPRPASVRRCSRAQSRTCRHRPSASDTTISTPAWSAKSFGRPPGAPDRRHTSTEVAKDCVQHEAAEPRRQTRERPYLLRLTPDGRPGCDRDGQRDSGFLGKHGGHEQRRPEPLDPAAAHETVDRRKGETGGKQVESS